MARTDRRRRPHLAAAAAWPLGLAWSLGLLSAAGCGSGGGAAPVAEEPAGPREPAPPPGGWPAGPLFEDATAAVGVDFLRFDGRTPDAAGRVPDGRLMYEVLGGGVAAFDYDADGRPDLLLTQGRTWPAGDHPPGPDDPADPDHRDALYRNVGGERFADVSDPARLPPGGFSHGVAAGDYNGDGFADLYVGDLAGPRLLRNDGDGTFTDVTGAAEIGTGGGRTGGALPAAMVASVVVADLNADGLPDLYDANYVHAADVYSRTCRSADGSGRSCGPREFASTPDRLLLNRGDGTFADASDAAGLPAGAGGAVASLGVVVADFDGVPGVETFVAADLEPNQLLVPRDDPDPGGGHDGGGHDGGGDSGGGGEPGVGEPGGGAAGGGEFGVPVPRLVDFGRLSGVAASGSQMEINQACMGVACGDVNADGKPEIFVTNFRLEPNALYRNWSSDDRILFEDETAAAGLGDGGVATLGFGAQFLDVDRDGGDDLLYVNGHIAQLEAEGKPFRMKPTLYLNDGAGRFREVPPAVGGPFFDEPDLGRGLARIDWDGDGRDEAVVNTMNSPATVLRNIAGGGSGVGLRVVNSAGDRDAVGATVTVTVPTGGEGVPAGPRARFVTAGDGYAASNERLLNFGLGATPAGAELAVSVKWPDGAEESFSGVTGRRAVPADPRTGRGRRRAVSVSRRRPSDRDPPAVPPGASRGPGGAGEPGAAVAVVGQRQPIDRVRRRAEQPEPGAAGLGFRVGRVAGLESAGDVRFGSVSRGAGGVVAEVAPAGGRRGRRPRRLERRAGGDQFRPPRHPHLQLAGPVVEDPRGPRVRRDFGGFGTASVRVTADDARGPVRVPQHDDPGGRRPVRGGGGQRRQVERRPAATGGLLQPVPQVVPNRRQRLLRRRSVGRERHGPATITRRVSEGLERGARLSQHPPRRGPRPARNRRGRRDRAGLGRGGVADAAAEQVQQPPQRQRPDRQPAGGRENRLPRERHPRG